VAQAFADDAERQGAYGLLESDAVAPTHVATAMFAAAARRSAGQDYVICPVDGTSVSLTDRDRQKGFGAVGARRYRGRGLKVINAMLLTKAGVPLGVTSQQWWTRSDVRRRKHRDQLRPEEKETHHWLEAMKETRTLVEQHAPTTRCWFQLDREGDAWPMLLEGASHGHWFTIRGCRNRRIHLPNGSRAHLKQVLADESVKTTYSLRVRAASNRQARIAEMAVRACTVMLDMRDKRTGRRFPFEVNVVHARERGTTPSGEKPIEWILLTNRPISARSDLIDVIVGYSMRWRIEELHRSWKSGACAVEDSQLRSPNAVKKWATILIAVAARIERIKHLSREEPDRPATDEFTPVEIKAAALLRFGKSGHTRVSPTATPTIAEVTLWIAQIGGYTGRASSGGPPGGITLARGLKEVLTAVKTLDAIGQ
jgi:hypothetical protein